MEKGWYWQNKLLESKNIMSGIIPAHHGIQNKVDQLHFLVPLSPLQAEKTLHGV